MACLRCPSTVGGAITKNPISSVQIPCSSGLISYEVCFVIHGRPWIPQGQVEIMFKFLCIRHSSSFIHSGAQLTFNKWINTPMQYSVCKSWLSYSWDDWLPLVEKRRSLEYHLLNVDSCLAVDQPPQHSSDPYEALSFLLSHLILPTPFK